MTCLRLAHLSDPHLATPLTAPAMDEWLSKRSLSRLSWAKSRQHLHKPAVLAAAIADIQAHAPDHIVITGDISNFSRPEEFRAAASWFNGIGDGEKLSVIPGNHDALVPVPLEQGWAHWRKWMQSDSADGDAPLLPYLRRRQAVALLGLSTAVPTPPGFAGGYLGQAQLDWLSSQLAALKHEGCFRIVMLHHPPADGVVPWRKTLTDRAALRAVLKAQGAELVLHGHSRDARFDPLPGPQGTIASFGLPSISAIPNPKDEGARWHLLEITSTASGWQLGVTVRRLDAAQQGFETTARYRLLMGR